MMRCPFCSEEIKEIDVDGEIREIGHDPDCRNWNKKVIE